MFLRERTSKIVSFVFQSNIKCKFFRPRYVLVRDSCRCNLFHNAIKMAPFKTYTTFLNALINDIKTQGRIFCMICRLTKLKRNQQQFSLISHYCRILQSLLYKVVFAAYLPNKLNEVLS